MAKPTPTAAAVAAKRLEKAIRSRDKIIGNQRGTIAELRNEVERLRGDHARERLVLSGTAAAAGKETAEPRARFGALLASKNATIGELRRLVQQLSSSSSTSSEEGRRGEVGTVRTALGRQTFAQHQRSWCLLNSSVNTLRRQISSTFIELTPASHGLPAASDRSSLVSSSSSSTKSIINNNGGNRSSRPAS